MIGVATILNGMSEAIAGIAPPLYTVEDFLTDIEIIQAFGYSASRDGAAIKLPLQEAIQRAKLLARPNHWQKEFLERVRLR